MPSPYNQHTSSELILSILKVFNVATKIKAIRSDSGGVMPPAMKIVRLTLNDEYGLHFDDNAFQIRCVCHIINRAVIDVTLLIREEVDMLRQLLKAFCGSVAIRVKFSDLTVLQGVATGYI